MSSTATSVPVNPSALRVLFVIANPVDLPRFDEERTWKQVSDVLQPLAASGSLVVDRLAAATENALRLSLDQNQWNVLHFVLHARERKAVNYATVALCSSDGTARNLTATHLAGFIAASKSVRLVVLQACDEASSCFETAAKVLIEQGMPVVATVPPLSVRETQVVLPKFYVGLLAGLNGEAMSQELAVALSGLGLPPGSFRLLSHEAKAPVYTAQPEAITKVRVIEQVTNPVPVVTQPTQIDWHQQLRLKRDSGTFDIFLCHNGADKPAVKRIAQQLKEAGILPWLDAWELPPGLPWQAQLERQIKSIKSAAVFVGSAGLGPWQEQEMDAFLRQFAKRKVPVIPVLLPDAPSAPELPPFLEAMTWVDFRLNDPNPLEKLIWGITGKRPGD
jgi:hypothetical protein